MMRQAVNFRLSPQAIHTIFLLKEKLRTTKTEVVEVALEAYAKQKLSTKNNLLSYAGALKNEEARNILNHIKTSRRNKHKDISL